MNHTPGPWSFGKEFKERCGDYTLHGRPISGGGKAIARVWSGSDRRLLELPEDEANARLIAAAPDLLAAAKAIAAAPYGIALGDLERLNAAIAKAEGQQ